MPEISIIVPVYNLERYLRECLDSIGNQTFSDWECILVDDGSSDSSGAICDEYAARDSRFRVIHQANGGVSVARNTGLDACRGRYIGFVDPDDYAHSDLFKRLHDLIVEYDADVAQVGIEKLYTTYTEKQTLVNAVTVYNRGEVAAELIYERRMPSYLWNKLFKREVIDTRFPVGQLYEDIYTISAWTRNIHKLVAAPDTLYFYRQRKGSITKSYVQTRMDYIRSIMYRASLFREMEPESVSEEMVNRYMWTGVIRAAKYIARYEKDPKIRIENIRKISVWENLAEPKLKYLGLKRWFRASLLSKNPTLFIRIIRMSYMFHIQAHRQTGNLFD